MIRLPHLETDVTRACQLSCVACNHATALWRRVPGSPPFATPEGVAHDLGRMARLVHADAWAAIGGEPLLSGRLLDILDVAAESEIADRIELWTNGLLLKVQPRALWRKIGTLVLSVYPGHPIDVEWVRARCRHEGVEFVLKDEAALPNFRTLLEPEPTGEASTASKFAGCFFRHFSRQVDHGYFFTCCPASSLPRLLQGREFGEDGIAIEGLTEDALSAYLTRVKPLGCCTICAGRDTAKPIIWGEERSALKWISRSSGVLE